MKKLEKTPTPIAFHQNLSFSRVFSTSIKGLEKEGIKRVFFPGCSLMAYNPDIVMKTYDYLKEKLPGIGMMMGCCGKPTKAIGNKKGFNEYYSGLQEELVKKNIEEVIVACSNCFMTIGENSSQIKIKSLWEVISQEGIPKEKVEIGKTLNVTFALHDPCPTRKETHIHDSVRNITKQLSLDIEEMKYAREKTLCCGAGNMLAVTNNQLAVKLMKKRAQQAQSDYMITYCEECVCSMKTGGKKAIHLLDILFSDPKEYRMPFDQQAQGAMTRWANRYKGKRKVDQIGKK